MPLIKSSSKQALKKNIETEMKANPSAKDRKQNIAIAYAVKRRAAHKKHMAQGGNVKLDEAHKSNKGPELYSSAPDTEGCPKCNPLSKGTLCESHSMKLGATEGSYPKEDQRYMHEGGMLDEYKSPHDGMMEEMPAEPQYDHTMHPAFEVGPEMSLLKHDEHSLKSEQLHEQAMNKRKLAKADALHLAQGGNVAPAGKNEHEHLSPGAPNEYMDAPSNDFMMHPDQPEVADAEHDAGSVDEEMDESLSGQILRKRRQRR